MKLFSREIRTLLWDTGPGGFGKEFGTALKH